MKIYLLSHERELQKATNTGRIVKACLGGAVAIIPWQRREPCREIIELIEADRIALLYPGAAADADQAGREFANYLLLDGTWQETRKMYNRSPYLQRASRVELDINQPSRYKLRRNQRTGGLSTAECVIELLAIRGQTDLAAALSNEFDLFNRR